MPEQTYHLKKKTWLEKEKEGEGMKEEKNNRERKRKKKKQCWKNIHQLTRTMLEGCSEARVALQAYVETK